MTAESRANTGLDLAVGVPDSAAVHAPMHPTQLPSEPALPPARWDETLLEFTDISIEQSAAYAALRWPDHEEPGPVLTDSGNVEALARVIRYPIPVLSGGLAYVKFGPVWRKRNRPADAAIYRQILERLIGEYCRRKRMLLTVHPRPHPETQDIERGILESLGFRKRRDQPDANRYFVDLRLSETEQRASLEQKWRRNLAKAEKSKLAIGIEEGAGAYVEFRALHAEMTERKNASHHDPVDSLAEICDGLPAGLRPMVVLARHNNRPVAGAVVAVHGDIAYYLYGASSGAALELRAGYALQWWIVSWLKRSGAAYYDLGGEAGSDGLRQFKRGLVGKGGKVVQMAGEYDYWSGPWARLTGDALYLAKRVAEAATTARARWTADRQ